MKYRALAIPILCGVFALPAIAQVRVNGYFSLDYFKGQDQSLFSYGSIQGAQAGFLFSGEWSPRFAYSLEIQSKDETRFEIEQAWAAFFWSDAVHVKVGLYLVPFGKYNESSRAFQTRLIQTPYPVADIFPASWRDVGVLIEGKSGFLEYAAYLGNGLAEGENLQAGQQFKDNNRDKGRGVRLGFLLSRNLTAGLSYYSGKIDAENERSLSLKDVDVTWTSGSIELTGEYAKADIDNPEPFARGTAEGWFMLLSLDFGTLKPLVAYEKYRYEDAFHGAGYASPSAAGLGVFEDRSLWAVGVVVALHQNVILKFEYDFNKESGLELRNNIFRAQAAVHF